MNTESAGSSCLLIGLIIDALTTVNQLEHLIQEQTRARQKHIPFSLSCAVSLVLITKPSWCSNIKPSTHERVSAVIVSMYNSLLVVLLNVKFLTDNNKGMFS